MSKAFACEHCGFDFEALSEQLEVAPSPQGGDFQGAVADDDGLVRRLRCPACGEPVLLSLAAVGVVRRGRGASATFVRWKRGANDDGAATIGLGRFTVRLTAVTALEPRDVCYERVPLLVDERGTLIVPTLPVRPEFFDCVDEQRARQHLATEALSQLDAAGQCQAILHLRGLEQPQRVTLRTCTRTGAPASAETAFRELNLRVWPNTPLEDWRFFLVGIAGTGPEGDALVREDRVRALVRVAGGAWERLELAQRGGAARVRLSETRPQLVALEVFDPGGARASAGGIFFAPWAGMRRAEGHANLALDFGTSNTCAAVDEAWSRDGNGSPTIVRPVTQASWNLYLVRSGPESTRPEGPDPWPSGDGFGKQKDMFPTEMLFAQKVKDVANRMESASEWIFGIDFGIPRSGIEPAFAEADHIVRYFKWAGLVVPAFRSHIGALQARYLMAFLLQTYVRASLVAETWPAQVNVRYSSPLSFDGNDLETLRTSYETACADLGRMTGVAWTVTPGLDESEAAAANAGTLSANVSVYIDMGGGSTDIAVKFGTENAKETVYVTSIVYAGSALLDALAGKHDAARGQRVGSCLAGSATLDVLHRRVRETANAKDLFTDPTLFNQAFLKTVTRIRIEHFYGYLTEYVARLLAAGILDRRFRLQRDGGPEFPETLDFGFFFLGNGWGMASQLTDAEPARVLADKMFKRMKDLVAKERTRGALDR